MAKRSENLDRVKVAMFSDLHVDYNYTEGRSNYCGEMLCCRMDSSLPRNESEKARKWGDYKCDLPPITFQSMLTFIKTEINPDIVLWGGNSVPQALDTLTSDQVVTTMKRVSEEIVDTLGQSAQIFATIGGHDILPENYFKADNTVFNKYKNTFDLFIDYQSRKSFKENGYYS